MSVPLSAAAFRLVRSIFAVLVIGGVSLNAVETYRWGEVALGGGGYVTGLALHPSEAGLHYARSDVAGVFRWDASAARWQPLLDWVSPDESNLMGCDGLALHPTNTSTVFAVLGKYAANTPSGLYKSTDRGVTWTQVLSKPAAANSDRRWHGEPVCVDPGDPQIVYFGTRTDGLWRSADGGSTWAKVASVPSGDVGNASDYWTYPPTGIRIVAADTSQVLVGIWGTGIYRSTDRGLTFTEMTGAPIKPARIQIGPGGVFYVTHLTGVSKYSGSAWSDVTPAAASGSEFVALAVDPSDANHVLAGKYSYNLDLAFYRTTNGGGAWTDVRGTSTAEPGWRPSNFKFAATAVAAFDPQVSGQVFYGDWYSVWRCPNIAATTPAWQTRLSGYEATVNLVLTSPPSGPALFSGFADVVGFRHEDTGVYPSQRLASASECLSIDFCEQTPARMAIVVADDWSGLNTKLYTSADNGSTWTARTLPNGVSLGRIAISSGNPNNLVYIGYNTVPYYSTDGGASWTASTGAPSGTISTTTIFNFNQRLAADRTTSDRFYLYKSNAIYRSDDGGATWTTKATGLPSAGDYAVLAQAPGVAHEVWVSFGTNGLYRSTDGGATFTKNNTFSTARSIAFGVAKPGTTTPTAYVFGKSGTVWAVWRSHDLGQNWERLSDDAHKFGNDFKSLTADRQVYGKVYLGSNGSGIRVGEPDTEVTFDQWRARRFTYAQRSATSGNTTTAAADADGDGLANLAEYALGLDPVTRQSAGALSVSSSSATGQPRLRLTFNRKARADITYHVDGSGDLQTWTEVWQSTGAANTEGAVTVTDTTDITNTAPRFLRLRPTLP